MRTLFLATAVLALTALAAIGALLPGLTLTRGKATGSEFPGSAGGAIHVDALDPAVSGGRTFEFRYQRNAKDLRYIEHRSSGLTSWTEIYRHDTSTGQITENGVSGFEDAAKQIITLTDPSTGPRLFWRLVFEPVT